MQDRLQVRDWGIRFLAVAMVAWFTSTVGAAESKNENNQLSFEGASTEVYKTVGEEPLKIHIFHPPATTPAPRPAVVFFFGGGWKSGSPKQFEQHCRYLASRGMVAMTADYRVANRHGTQAKECVQDGKSAIRWVRKHAERLNIDPQRIAAGGGSAGGHVAACTGVISGFEEPGEDLSISSKPAALILFNPAVSLAPIDGQPSIPPDRAGNLRERVGTDPEELSPAHQVHGSVPPTILFFGSEDFLLEGAKFFHSQMQAAGNRCEFKLYDGFAHGFFNFGRHANEPFVKTLQAADEFLVSLGWLPNEGNVQSWLDTQSHE